MIRRIVWAPSKARFLRELEDRAYRMRFTVRLNKASGSAWVGPYEFIFVNDPEKLRGVTGKVEFWGGYPKNFETAWLPLLRVTYER